MQKKYTLKISNPVFYTYIELDPKYDGSLFLDA